MCIRDSGSAAVLVDFGLDIAHTGLFDRLAGMLLGVRLEIQADTANQRVDLLLRVAFKFVQRRSCVGKQSIKDLGVIHRRDLHYISSSL